uniref:Zinc knuckle CX2CX4HX4C domain-containing protein n=1 Tax=Quercus lobata TaxID=97700 RepID=A0A7N2M9X1_QUELO
MQKYDGTTPTQDLSFTTAKFWVQLHNLPHSLLTTEAALSLGKTLGTIAKPKDDAEMRRGNFMCVRVAVDITKPLCRGRKVSWDQTEKEWVSFLYKRLPNICYWCGLLSHDDKDCVLWLNSKGTLTAVDQQFGPWIRAPQFNPVRRAVVEAWSSKRCDRNHKHGGAGGQSVATHMETEEHGGGVSGGVDRMGSDVSLSQSQNHGALNGGIDCTINSEVVTLDHNTIQPGKYSEMERINLEYKVPVVKPNSMDVERLTTLVQKFTWIYQKADGSQIRERLDRSLATPEWLALFPTAKLFHLTSSASEHSPLALRMVKKSHKRRQKKMFRFEAMWLKDQRCEGVVQAAWDEGLFLGADYTLGKCMEICRTRLEGWNKTDFGNVGRKISDLQKRLEWIELQPTTPDIVQLMRNTRIELNGWLDKEDAMWRQRSRLTWF